MGDDTSQPANGPWPYATAIPQRFSTRYQRYRQLGGLVDVVEDAHAYAGEEPMRDVERLMFLNLALDQIHKESVPGDYVELGVYKGSTAAVLARHARRLNRQLFLLDTYEGFDPRDFSGMDSGRAVAFADTSLDAVRARVGEAGTCYVKGYFPETAEMLPSNGQYCLVHIDLDLYLPILRALEYFYPRMAPGGYMIVHDYGSLTWEGAEKAVDFFFADKPESVLQIPDSCGSAVVRRLRPLDDGSNWIAKRRRLAPGEWHTAADGKLSHVLADGWSSPEAWGTWGVGASHAIELAMPTPSDWQTALDLDVHGFVWDEANGRPVDIFVNKQWISEITFRKTPGFLTLTLDLPSFLRQGPSVVVEFRPRARAVPNDLDPTVSDTRELGVALHRIRLRSEAPGEIPS